MSYDYNNLLEQIRTSRSINPQTPSVIEETLNHFTTLSTNCPMTPMLWMQYAHDAGHVLDLLEQEDGSKDITCQILELAMAEFPSCAMLRLYHLDCVIAKDRSKEVDKGNGNVNGNENSNGNANVINDDDEVKKVWEDVAHSVCLGSHGGCDEPIIVAIFNLYTNYLIKKGKTSEAAQVFLTRGGLFMKNGNDTLRSEINVISEKSGTRTGTILTDSDYQNLEISRQFASQHLSFLGNLEDDILIAMESDGISLPPDLNLFTKGEDETNENAKETFYDWTNILKESEQSSTYLMGFGMIQTSTSFIRYTQAIVHQLKQSRRIIEQSSRKRKRQDDNGDNDDSRMNNNEEMKHKVNILNRMIIHIFERGIAECPTVEMIWEKYIKHLFYTLHDAKDKDPAVVTQTLIQVKNIAARAVRNCPYSVKLFSLKMAVIQEEVNAGIKVLDPDELSTIVKEAVEGKFLPSPENNVEVFMAACEVVKQRILDMVSRATSTMAFDEAEDFEKNRGKKRKRDKQSSISNLNLYSNAVGEEIDQEVRDLIEDIREMYDAADMFVRTNFKSMTQLRETIFREKANTEAYICVPILSTSNSLEEVVGHYAKMLKIHQPSHPDSWRCYIRFLMGSNFMAQPEGQDDATSELLTGTTAAKLRYIRGFYHQSMTSTKKEKRQHESWRFDARYIVSLKALCQDFLDFENDFGSSKSKATAKRMTEGKLALIGHLHSEVPIQEQQLVEKELPQEPLKEKSEEEQSKDQREDDQSKKEIKEQTIEQTKDETKEPSQEKEKVEEEECTIETKKDEKESLKIWVGKLQCQAHPFTIHVSNLSPLTQDMDLYDLFRVKCGAVVHARIFREKQHNISSHGERPKSKCTGLIQFEERESVKKALQLNGEIGLNEKLINIKRSHQPAVSVVPSGMHRVQPKGEGKSTKRNQKRKERRLKEADGKPDKSKEADDKPDKSVTKDTPKPVVSKKNGTPASNTGILHFRPRGVAQRKRKTKLIIPKK